MYVNDPYTQECARQLDISLICSLSYVNSIASDPSLVFDVWEDNYWQRKSLQAEGPPDIIASAINLHEMELYILFLYQEYRLNLQCIPKVESQSLKASTRYGPGEFHSIGIPSPPTGISRCPLILTACTRSIWR